MKTLKDAKNRYDSIPVPDELNERVQKAIRESATSKSSKVTPFYQKHLFKYGACAAALVIAFTTTLNTNVAFATGMQELPVIGAIAKVLTFRSYEEKKDNVNITVNIPKIEVISEDTKLPDSINQKILSLCEQYVTRAEQDAEEYRKAFMETGGTEEEWAAHNLRIDVGYSIEAQNSDYLSFSVYGAESWVSSNNEFRYYNIDLKTEQFVTLKDILGEDYITLANESIKEQITDRTKEQGDIFFPAESGGFTSISDETNFYINETGNPVIVFDKYEIAIGAAGRQEFEIQKSNTP